MVVVGLKNNAGERTENADPPDDDGELRLSGEKTYRLPKGRPHWAQPVDLILPIISPAEGWVAVASKDRACHNSGSADRADYRSTNGLSNPEFHSESHHSEAAKREVSVPQCGPPILESQAATGTVQSCVGVEHGATESVGSQKPMGAEIDVEHLGLLEDSSTPCKRHAHSFFIPTTDVQPGRKSRGMPTKDSRATSAFARRSNSGSGRADSRDPARRLDRNEVGSARRVSVRDSAATAAESRQRPAPATDKTALEKTRILNEVNRKFGGASGGRELVTSSVTAVVSPRSCSARGNSVRSSASLGAQRTMTSSKAGSPAPRRLAVTQIRVGLRRLSSSFYDTYIHHTYTRLTALFPGLPG